MNSPEDRNFKSNNSQPEDRILWQAFKSGNRLAFSTLYDLHVDSLYRYGCSITQDSQMVEDAIQDLFVYLWDNRQNTTEVDNIKFYLFKALRNNLTRMIMKNSASSGPVIRQGEYATKESCILSHMEELAHIEDTETIEMRVRELVNLLSGRQREVLYLRFFQDMNYEQISSLLEIDLKYTYNIYSKAILQLKRYLAEGFNLFVD